MAHLLVIVIIPPVLGIFLKYLLQKSSDVNRSGSVKPDIMPKDIPVVLHVDA